MKKLLFGVAVWLCMGFISQAQAGCAEYDGIGWIADTTTEKVVKQLGKGKVVECGNVYNAFAVFKQKTFSAGLSTCLDKCAEGIRPEVLYIQLNGKSSEGKYTTENGTTCVQPNGNKNKYCWKSQ